jgi:hypothetical protein
MNKIEILVLAFCLLAMVLPAAADGIWAPIDEYIIANDQSCNEQERPYFFAAGKQGSVTAMKTPLDRRPVNTWPNDTEFRISYVCGKGKDLWAVVQSVRSQGQTDFTEAKDGIGGYIPLSDLKPSYDTVDFTKEHAKEIKPFDEKKYNFCKAGEFALWMTPNSGAQIKYVTADEVAMLCRMMEESGGVYKRYKFGGTYTDKQGKRWVEFTYNYREHGWFCLDQMTKGGVKPKR